LPKILGIIDTSRLTINLPSANGFIDVTPEENKIREAQ
jgi:hypothetical protein